MASTAHNTRKKQLRLPKYRYHKASGRAVIQYRPLWGGNPIYLPGPFNSDESLKAYDERCKEIVAHKSRRVSIRTVAQQSSASTSIAEIVGKFLIHAETYYGGKKAEFKNLKCAARPMIDLHYRTLAVNFGPRAMKEVRAEMIRLGWSRRYINAQVNRIRRMFRWAVSEELIDGAVLVNLESVSPLYKGKTTAREKEEISQVSWAVAEKVLSFVSPLVADMVRVHHLTGMRSDELTGMRPEIVDRSKAVWIYQPPKHKTEHRGKKKIICLGPRAQSILSKYLVAGRYFFRPEMAHVQRSERRAAARKTKPQSRDLQRPKRPRKVRDRYTATSYQHAINHGFVAMARVGGAKGKPAGGLRKWLAQFGIEYWHPHQLRHTRGTDARADYGIEGAQALLGNTMEAAEIYADKSVKLAMKIASETG